jgi:hypothetical protein
VLFEFSYAESLQCRLIIDIFTHGLDLDPFSILQVDWGCRIKKGGIKFDKKKWNSLVALEKGALGKGCFWKRVLLEMAELENGRLEKGALGKGWIGKGCSWKRLLLETGAFGNGWIGKWLFGKGCSWKKMNWKMVLLEMGAFGKWTFGKGCSWKRMRKNEK